MNINTGEIYENYEAAKKAGVPDDLLVTGTRPALENLRKKLVFSKGSFKSVVVPTSPAPETDR